MCSDILTVILGYWDYALQLLFRTALSGLYLFYTTYYLQLVSLYIQRISRTKYLVTRLCIVIGPNSISTLLPCVLVHAPYMRPCKRQRQFGKSPNKNI